MIKFLKAFVVKQVVREPMIFTTKGNLPISSLQMKVSWEDCSDFTKVKEVYTLNGEVVRESAHVLSRKEFTMEALNG